MRDRDGGNRLIRSGFWVVAVFVLVLDQWTKYLVTRYLPDHGSVTLIPNVLFFTHVHNTGTAFGLLPGSSLYLTGVAVIAVILIVWYWFRTRSGPDTPSGWLLCGLALPLGGALGNLIDRLRVGHVIDFIDFRVWPVFNVADSAITVGACLVAYYFFFLHDRLHPAQERVASCELRVVSSDPNPEP